MRLKYRELHHATRIAGWPTPILATATRTNRLNESLVCSAGFSHNSAASEIACLSTNMQSGQWCVRQFAASARSGVIGAERFIRLLPALRQTVRQKRIVR
jgi:hypothetical protein